MTLFGLALESLKYHWRRSLAVMLGVAAATAVLTGALLVGDSMRGSLRELTLERLGNISSILVTDRFFRPELATQLSKNETFKQDFDQAVPAMLLQGTLSSTHEQPNVAGRVTIVGSDERFWSLGQGGSTMPVASGQVVLNRPLANKLDVKAGDDVILRVGRRSQIPADSPLGRKTDTVRSERLTVSEVIPAEGLGRFGLQATQRQSLLAQVPTETLQQMLEQPNRVNAILVSTRQDADQSDTQHTGLDARLESMLKPTLADYGLLLQPTERGYINFTSDRMLLSEPAERAAKQAFAKLDAQPVLTYLANNISAGEGKIPYSTVTAMDMPSGEPLGPIVDADGKPIDRLADEEIVLNSWAADDLKAQGVELKPGDKIEFTYFLPESTHGEIREATHSFRFKAVAKLEGAAADPNFTPELKGITDKRSIANWDPPFPYDPSRVRSTPPNDQDEQYWNDHKTTPKAFISLVAGRKLWGSRFGETTSLRIPQQQGISPESLAAKLKLDPVELGFDFLPVKQQGLQAAGGTTPFEGLFLGFSFFIIASAVLLVALLFRLQMDQRAKELGIIAASGIRQRQVAGLLAIEGLIVCLIGGAVGVLLGIGYAKLMIAALSSPAWWQGAISTPFLKLFITPQSLIIGFVSGSLVALLFILWSLRRLSRAPVRQLLSGQSGSEGPVQPGRRAIWNATAVVLLIGAIALGLFALRLGGEAQAGAFFGSGAFVLLACLLLLRTRLRSVAVHSSNMQGNGAIARLAARNASRNPTRSTLTVALVGSASFLIVAISAFRLDPQAVGLGKDSGSGGFTLVAESDLLIHQRLDTDAGQNELGIADDTQAVLKLAKVISLRVQAGDDASCLNLYRPTQPRALGVTSELVERGGFAWADSAAQTDDEKANPWLLLERTSQQPESDSPPVPVVLDMNTAMYSLHLWKGVGEEFTIRDGFGRPLRLQVVGLLKNSIFQGDLLMSDRDLIAHFPEVSGYQFFLVDCPPGDQKQVQQALQSTLGDFGFIAEPALDRLADFLIVQNTYLTTFQSLGGLGLLLGTFGLATVQLRNVLERRSELALMRATGWRSGLLARLILYENGAILLGGLLIGVCAALVAVLPHLVQGGAGIPWRSLVGTLGLVAIVGLLAGWLAARSALRADLIATLRAES